MNGKAQRQIVNNRSINPDSEPKDKFYVTPAECGAMRLLRRDGYNKNLLKLMFHVSTEEAVRTHITGQCECPSEIEPVD